MEAEAMPCAIQVDTVAATGIGDAMQALHGVE